VAYRSYFRKIAGCKHLFIVRPMKTTLAPTFVAMILSTILLSSGCQKKTAATNPASESNGELRGSTKPLQAADLVGYDGKRLRRSVDHIMDANEKHNQDIEKMAGSGPDQ
jgi:hypothetical protein